MESSPERRRVVPRTLEEINVKHMVALALLLAACTGATTSEPGASAPGEPTTPAEVPATEAIVRVTESLTPELVALRRDVHQHPELSGREERTAARIADELRALGLEVRTGVGGHGVVGVLRGSRPGPVVAYRADMDASVGDEPTGREYGSRVPGVFHVCGHDLHSAIGVGVASVLGRLRPRLPGTVVFLFQPAEETLEGARAMLADDAFAGLRPDVIYALHTGPMPVGTIGTGADMAGQDRFELTLAKPVPTSFERAVARLKALGTVSLPGGPASTSQDESAPERRVYAVIDADTKGARARIRGWLRAERDEDYAVLRSEVRAILDAELPAGSFELQLPDAPFPSMRSDRQVIERAQPTLIQAVGAANVIAIDRTHLFNGEDFALWLERAPGAMFILGVANAERGITGVPHSPDYDADERAIPLGTKAMSLLLWRELGGS